MLKRLWNWNCVICCCV